jgi:hypothetical protein
MATGQGGFWTNGVTIATAADIDSSTLLPADTQNPNGATPQSLAVPLGLIGQAADVATGITAHAGGGAASAYQLDYGVSNVTIVGTNADSVKLPAAIAGKWCFISNQDSAQSIQIFGGGTSTINGVAYGTGVAQAAGLSGLFYCVSGTGDDVAGAWVRLLSA